MNRFVLVCWLVATSVVAQAQIRLPKLISDGMVLQREVPLRIWGWAKSGEKITVQFKRKNYKTVTDTEGKWQVELPPMAAGGPFIMEIGGSSRLTLKDILIGDVWFCSGQSNMVHQLTIHDITYAKEIREANFPQIRQFWVPTLTQLQSPQRDLPSGQWKAAVGEDVRPFSAVAYFFAKKIHQKYNVPVGIINASVGGTPIEAWISEEGLRDFSALKTTIDTNKDTAYVNRLTRSQPARPAPPVDAGLAGTTKWYDMTYRPSGWRTINVPGYWEDQGVKDLNGVVWYRREIDVPASMTGKPAKVFLGRVTDADEFYINGRQVGKTTYQYPQRRYSVPDDVLKAGKNLLVVRVTNTAGKGGFVPDKPYCLFAGADTLDLKGTWQYKVGTTFPPSTGGGLGGGINAQNQPTALYNAMVAPETSYAIKGFCWYQGESNAGKPQEYETLLRALLADWRRQWEQGDLPFLYVQLPGFMDYNYLPSESNWALLREAQLNALTVPNTAMAVAIDLGEWNDIHPDNKKDVGERLALAALKTAYRENVVSSGPLYQSSTVNGGKLVIRFTHIGGGLMTNDGEEVGEFAIAGSDKKFVWAHAKIDGDNVVVWSDEVPAPLYVRYAWADNPVHPNLYNKEKLPASPFRTDK
ncbi:sialate O-acetylesterase [Spirosoma utsteinense]|uniref:Sialate O-acetylesterase n=1 Tax=Spirosoma utsteinense TaxID=2585773 RepID=A0ABR6VZ31_9BACT|nr:sialate O-acetylesterase [Spirosoma utsteinense]MBC3784690.1 sialate O-acetylesterase [Spirosoma utsteinense]MBC3789556.1 sialate O-acetylesterase [Spirosoma utsteinense]